VKHSSPQLRESETSLYTTVLCDLQGNIQQPYAKLPLCFLQGFEQLNWYSILCVPALAITVFTIAACLLKVNKTVTLNVTRITV